MRELCSSKKYPHDNHVGKYPDRSIIGVQIVKMLVRIMLFGYNGKIRLGNILKFTNGLNGVGDQNKRLRGKAPRMLWRDAG
jgi:hypothetical protein